MALNPELLHEIIRSATAVPLEHLQETHRKQMQEQIRQMEAQTQQLHQAMMAQTEALSKLQVTSSSASSDPLRKLKEKDPQFPNFTGKSDHFLPWILECQIRKENRQLPDDVAIQYAVIALGEHSMGLLPKGVTLSSWEDFVQELRPKFLRHTMDWQLVVESEHWRMNGDWPRFHSIVQTYRMFTPSEFHITLMLNMIKALDPYLQRKVAKEPKPRDLDEAIKRTWDAHRTAQPPVPPHAPVAQQSPPSAYSRCSWTRCDTHCSRRRRDPWRPRTMSSLGGPCARLLAESKRSTREWLSCRAWRTPAPRAGAWIASRTIVMTTETDDIAHHRSHPPLPGKVLRHIPHAVHQTPVSGMIRGSRDRKSVV